ncbi:aldehyde dehydrogenase family protein [Rubrobacter naiadicus]|uniref:aldehyde dehydrogenase family protein n=1 Tax=Rubrobacter naiadicus TaxID=1392641 RepID=UPI0023605676|nr:aldehyde dehydrogenase family protein [Rubrobacter naiadicus]
MQRNLIGGEICGEPGRSAAVYNPATGGVVEEVTVGSAGEVDAAVAAAVRALSERGWAENASLRSSVLYEWAKEIEAHLEELTWLLSLENGKLLSESEAELSATVDTLRFAAGQARTLEGRSLTLAPDLYGQVVLQPVGVVAVIVPWNWPVLLTLRELAPALAAGNTAVVKPAMEAPLTVMRVLEFAMEIPGFPAGVVNCVAGEGGEVGELLVSHPNVRMVSFTGSVQTGKKIMRSASECLKKVVLELGGKSPSIVFEDADLNKALAILVRGAYGTAGQNCMAVARILVQDTIFEEVEKRFVDLTESIKVGPGLDPTSKMGPVISERQLERIHTLVEQGLSSGGKLLAGGSRIEGGSMSKGCFYAPTVIAEMPLSSPAVQEEIFGPVVSLERFADEEEACALANGTPYGLVASVWTSDHNRAERVARRLEVGTVWINTYLKTFPEAESGGMKQSGLGRSRGRFGIYEYMEPKHIVSDIAEG